MIESGRPLERIFGGCLTARTDAHQILCKPPARYGHPCTIRIAFGFGFSDFSLSVPIDFREKDLCHNDNRRGSGLLSRLCSSPCAACCLAVILGLRQHPQTSLAPPFLVDRRQT